MNDKLAKVVKKEIQKTQIGKNAFEESKFHYVLFTLNDLAELTREIEEAEQDGSILTSIDKENDFIERLQNLTDTLVEDVKGLEE